MPLRVSQRALSQTPHYEKNNRAGFPARARRRFRDVLIRVIAVFITDAFRALRIDLARNYIGEAGREGRARQHVITPGRLSLAYEVRLYVRYEADHWDGV